MPQNRPRTPASASHAPDGRRRHAAPSRPNWTRRAGIVGGVVSAVALSGAAAPALADNHSSASRDSRNVSSRTVAAPTAAPLSTTVTGRQAADAIAQDAIEISIAAGKQAAAEQAAAQAKAAAAAAADHKAAVAAKAAKVRATATALAASRSAKRAAAPASTSASATVSTAASAAATSAAPAVPASGTKVDQLIAFLKAQVGKPYVYGATGPSSYDCSGLTQAAFQSVGVTLPRTSQEQSTVGTPVPLGSLQPGDLIFWGGEGSAYHVGVYIGGGNYLDAANPSRPIGIEPLTYSEPDWAVRVL